MPFNCLYARYSHLRVVFTVVILLHSWLVQSCTARNGSTPSPMHTTANALTPAEAAAPPAPQTLPVVIAFTDPTACAAFEHVGYPCRGIE